MAQSYDSVICPRCGHEHDPGGAATGLHTCDGCGKEFVVDVEVSYQTYIP